MNLNQALKLLRNKKSIIPVGSDKRPDFNYIKDWKKYQKEYPTEEEVTKWFDNGDRNIAVVTGKISDITVIDLDLGSVDYRTFPRTFTVRSGSGGYHLYYRYCETPAQALRNEHIDIKNDGGYVLAPFCVTEDKIENGQVVKKGGKYEIVEHIAFSNFPQDSVPHAERRFDRTVLEDITEKGGRNNTLTSVIGFWLASTPKKLWDTVFGMALQWNKNNCIPPLPEWEVNNIYKSLVVREAKKNRKIDVEYQEEIIPSEVVKLYESSDDHAKSLTGEKFATGIELLDQTLGGGLQTEHLAVISGYTGEGKSLFAMYITAQMLKKNTPVLWFQFELPPTEFWDKYQKLGVTKEMPVYVPKVYKTATMDWVEEIIIKGKELGIQVVVFDLLDFLQSNEKRNHDKNQEDGEIVTRLKLMASKHKVAIILMAHSRKPLTEERQPTLYDIRGTGQITGIANWVLMVYRVKYDKKSGELKTRENTKYSSYSLQKNRINGKEFTLYGYYTENFDLVVVPVSEVREEQKKDEDLEEYVNNL